MRFGYGRWGGVGYIVQWAFLLGLDDIVIGQGSSTWDPVNTVCSIVLAQGVVLGDKMYVDGGEILNQQYFLNGVDKPYFSSGMTRWQNEHLWELDLSSKFNVSKPPWTAHSKPQNWNQHYNGASGTLWDIGDGGFYTLGGWMNSEMEGPPPGQKIGEPYYTQNISGFYFQLPDPRIFAYDPKSGNWSSSLLRKDIYRLSDTGYAQSARNKVGYTLGGLRVVEEMSSPTAFAAPDVTTWLSSMSTYDFRTKNLTTTDIPVDINLSSRVEMHSLDRVGNEGVLVAFAGRTNTIDNNGVEGYRPMDEILVYDIETSTWMKQNATGDIPPGRQNTCTALVPAPDLSSYQIYVFSGVSYDVRILDMYVLSIPMFSWTKIEMKNYPEQYGIAEMACGLYEERQFIIVPGEANVTVSNMTIPSGSIDNWWLECNQDTKIRVFDTYDWEFKSEFDPNNKGSKVPPAIVKLIGGSDTGGATLHKPAAGWDNPALGPIFQIRNQLPPSDLSTPTSGLNSETKKPAKPNKGAIIGGVIGGICLVAFIVGVLIFFCRKKPQKHSQAQTGVELHGADFIAEMHANNSSHELYAYEPLEIGVTEGRYNGPPKEDTITVDHASPPPL